MPETVADPVDRAIADLKVAVDRLRVRINYMSVGCKLCGAGYGRHFTDCPGETFPRLVKELEKVLQRDESLSQMGQWMLDMTESIGRAGKDLDVPTMADATTTDLCDGFITEWSRIKRECERLEEENAKLKESLDERC